MNFSSVKYNSVFTSIIGLILFLLSVFPHFVTLGIVLLALTIIYGYVKKQVTFRMNKITLLFVTLYLAYVVGLFFSDNLNTGFKYLEYKLSLLVFPFLLMIQSREPVSHRNVFIGFISGCIIGALIGLYHGMNCYMETGVFNCFLSSSVSTIIHPTYFSAYTTIAIVALWVGYSRKYTYFKLLPCIVITLFLAGYTLFMMSLMGMLYMGLMIFVVIAAWFYKKWNWIGVSAFVILTPLLMVLSYKTVPQIQHEVDDVIYYGKRYLANSDQYFESLYYPYSGTESRLIMWKVSIEQLSETPMGLGTGDVDAVLQNRMRGQLDDEFVEKNLNSHNQYLQTGLEVGIIGLFILILPFVLLFIKALKEKNILLLALVISFMANCLFESMLQRQSGVVFYVLLVCFLTIPSITTSKDE
jgi:O-antigen ligase